MYLFRIGTRDFDCLKRTLGAGSQSIPRSRAAVSKQRELFAFRDEDNDLDELVFGCIGAGFCTLSTGWKTGGSRGGFR